MAIGGGGLLIFRGSKQQWISRGLIAFSFVLLMSTTLYTFSPSFRARISDQETENSHSASNFERFGSGRLVYSKLYLYSYANSSLAEQLFGCGERTALSRMESLYGKPLVAHNGFVDVLVRHGVTGFIIFLYYLYHLLKYATRGFSSGWIALPITPIFSAYILSILTQGNNNFLIDVMVALAAILARSISQHRENSV